MNSKYPGSNLFLQMIYHREPLELYSPLPPGECVKRLSDAIDDDREFGTLFGYLGSKELVGRVVGDSLRVRKRIHNRNSFRPRFTATIGQHEDGALIRGEFSTSFLERFCYSVWMGMVGSACIALLIGALVGLCRGDFVFDPWGLLPFGMLLFGYLLARLCWFCVRKHPNFIVNFLCDLLDAKETQAAPK